MLELLITCVQKPLSLTTVAQSPITSKIYLAYFRKHRNQQLLKYLVQDSSWKIKSPPKAVAEPIISPIVEQVNNNLAERAILELLLTKLKAFGDAWVALSGERASNVNHDVVSMVATLCLVSKIFLTRINGLHAPMSRDITELAERLWQTMFDFVSKQDTDIVQHLSSPLVSTVLGLRAEDPADGRALHLSLSTLVSPLLTLLQTCFDSQAASIVIRPDLMDLEDSFMSQASQNVTEVHDDAIGREEIPFSSSEQSSLIRMTVELFVLQVSANEQCNSETAPVAKIIEYLVSLSPAHLLAARQPIIEFLSHASNLTRAQAAAMLKKIAAGCMQDDNYERCESSLCLCLDVMTALARLWAIDVEGDDLQDLASDMYGWFLEVPLGKGLASPQVLKGIAIMLEVVLEINADFSRNTSMRSPRTSLFQILQTGDNSVKHHVAKQICRIFDRFVLTEHEAILDDVVESLPSDPEKVEGIALRLYILAELAGKWNTLLRRSVYHVFETAAQVHSSIPYAQQCLRELCYTLNLPSPREIFLLFCPQILYTWLEKESIETIPFAIYGYESLKQLLHAAKDELVGQIAMRASAQQASDLSQALMIPWEDMLRQCFAKAEAYTIARDISMPARGDSAKSTESVLRKQLGTENYLQSVEDLFPDVVATLFVTLGEEQGIDRAFAKREGFSSAKATILEIVRLSHSEVVLPLGQQPSFRAKFLLDELDFLCHRIDLELKSIWTAPMVVHVSRTLFDSAVPALGSLFACAVLRKVRILISLAGPIASSGYPVEMLLHAIRPFLTDFHCSEDALGMFWYLLDKGKPYLQSRASFMLGTVVATFTSLTAFLSSAQESTTQEGHFKSTMSKAQVFHDWFGKYLETFQPKGLSEDKHNAFKRIANAASKITKPGSAFKGSHEGDLLLELLDDRTSRRHLLGNAAFDIAFELACTSFEAPVRPREDILGEDARAVLHAPVIWDIVLQLKLSPTFRTWAAQTLGRAYAATGIISDKLSREQDTQQFETTNGDDLLGSNSDVAILRHVHAMLLTDNRVVVGQAERTLQMIITQLRANDTIGIYDNKIDSALVHGLQWTTFPCPEPILSRNLAKEPVDPPRWDIDTSAQTWAAELALTLCLEMSQDPILWALRYLVSEQADFAERVLPAIIHKVLLSTSVSSQKIRQSLSDVFNEILRQPTASLHRHIKLVNTTILYLRCQALPKESTMAERNLWLDIDYAEAAAAAVACKSQKTALLLFEVSVSQRHLQAARSSRRASATRGDDPDVLAQSIFQELDDPDFFYGVQETASVDSLLRKLDHEGDGLQKLSFQSALYDSSLKCLDEQEQGNNVSGILSALSAANLDGLARAVQMNQKLNDDLVTSDSVLSTGLNLHQWDLPPLVSLPNSTRAAFMTFRQLTTFRNRLTILSTLDQGLLEAVEEIANASITKSRLHKALGTLAIMTEVKETLASNSIDDLNDQWQLMTTRDHWMKFERHVQPLMPQAQTILIFDAVLTDLAQSSWVERRFSQQSNVTTTCNRC